MRNSFFKKLVSSVSYTNRLILANVLMFFAFLIVLSINSDYIRFIELNPANILSGKYLWTLLTSMFMHQGGLHLFVNMLSLFFLGNLAEQIIGRRRFLVLYFIAGLLGGILFVFGAWFGSFVGLESVLGGVNDFAAGASGALFGLLGVLAVLLPRYRVYLVMGPIAILVLEVILLPFLPAGVSGIFEVAFTILMILSIFAMFSGNPTFRKISLPVALSMWVAPIVAIVPLVILSLFIALPIGNTAHLGGLIAGLAFGIFLRLKYPKKIEVLQRVFG